MSEGPHDHFFGGPGGVPTTGWDGEPLLLMTMDSWTEIMAFAPHYNGVIEGPVPLGMDSPIQLIITRIHRPSRESAAALLYEHATNICAKYSFPYDPDEWTITSLGPRGCS